MRIATNTLSNEIVRQIQQLSSKQAKLQNQVATGQRIFQPEDDPTAVGRVLNLESEQRNTTQYQQNATRAMIDHLAKMHQLSRQDAYLLCSLVVDLKISEIVDAGVWNVGMTMPLAVFV